MMMTVPVDPGQLAHPGVEHIPWSGTEVAVDQQGDADTEQGEPDKTSSHAFDWTVAGDEAMPRRGVKHAVRLRTSRSRCVAGLARGCQRPPFGAVSAHQPTMAPATMAP